MVRRLSMSRIDSIENPEFFDKFFFTIILFNISFLNKQSWEIRKMRIKKIEISRWRFGSLQRQKSNQFGLAAMLCLTFMPGILSGNQWNVQLSLAHGFDDNVFRVNQGLLARISSSVTQLEPTLSWKGTAGLSLQYNPQITIFHSENAENVIRHNFGFRHAGEAASGINWQLSSNSIRVQGPSESVIFDQGRNAFSTAAARERRNQWQNRSRLEVGIPMGNFEIIPETSLLYYDLDPVRKPGLAGYDNYVNRYDLRSGLRVEKEFQPGTLIGAEAQIGYQHHGRQGDRLTSRSNHYHRFLLSWHNRSTFEKLRFKFRAGPAFHRYDNGPGPLKITQWFIDATASYQLSDHQQIGFRWHQFNWVSGSGLLSNHDKTYAIHFTHGMGAKWSVKLEALARGINYHGTPVKDWVYSGIFEIEYLASENFRLNLNVEHNQGRDEALSRPGREFHRTWVNIKSSWSW